MSRVLVVIKRDRKIAAGKIRSPVFGAVENAKAIVFQIFIAIAGIKDDFGVIGYLQFVLFGQQLVKEITFSLIHLRPEIDKSYLQFFQWIPYL